MFWRSETMNLPIFDDIKIYLPKYLSDRDTDRLWQELRSFPDNLDKRFYTSRLHDAACLFQGDVVKGIEMPDHQARTFKKVTGLLVSNTCDAATENKRLYRPYLMFAPVINLQKWENALLSSAFEVQKVQSHIQAIRQQKVSPFFFLPQSGPIENDCFARLDCSFSFMASDSDLQQAIRNRILTLSNYGFYMLLFKTSMHFTRVQENVDRGS